jgi:hypothetical protein
MPGRAEDVYLNAKHKKRKVPKLDETFAPAGLLNDEKVALMSSADPFFTSREPWEVESDQFLSDLSTDFSADQTGYPAASRENPHDGFLETAQKDERARKEKFEHWKLNCGTDHSGYEDMTLERTRRSIETTVNKGAYEWSPEQDNEADQCSIMSLSGHDSLSDSSSMISEDSRPPSFFYSTAGLLYSCPFCGKSVQKKT